MLEGIGKMTLHLDGQRLECLSWRVDAPEGGHVIWRFITAKGEVYRVCHDSRFTEARTSNTDADTVRVVSLFWPVQELCAAICKAKTDTARRELAEAFLANLVRQFDPAYPGTFGSIKMLVPVVRDSLQIETEVWNIRVKPPPPVWVKKFCEGAAKLGPTPNRAARAGWFKEVGAALDDLADADEATHCGWSELSLAVKRLALKYDTLTPEPVLRVATPRFGTLHARTVEDRLFRSCRKRVVTDERADAKTPDGYAFQSFLVGVEYVSVHRWPDYPVVLPVLWIDTEPIKATAADRAFAGVPTGAAAKRKPHGKVSIKDAASFCKVSPRTIKYWDAGEHTPDGWSGRNERTAFIEFAKRREKEARIRDELKNKVGGKTINNVRDLDQEDRDDDWSRKDFREP